MAASKAPLDPIIVGVDPGNATTTVASGGKIRAFFPSLRATVGVGPYNGMPVISTDGGHISRAGSHAVIGCPALDEMGADTLLRALPEDRAHERYTSAATLDTLLVAIGCAFPEPECIGVALGIGMPSSLASQHGESVAASLKGAYDFVHQGRKRRIIFDTVRVFAEGREAIRLLTPAQMIGPVAIHDIGGRTYNLNVYRNGGHVKGDALALGIDKLLDRVPSASPTPVIRWSLMNDLRTKPKSHPAIRKDLAALLFEAVLTWEGKYTLESAVRHVVIGGGAFALAPVLERRYPNSNVIVLGGDRSEQINALTYAKAIEEAAK